MFLKEPYNNEYIKPHIKKIEEYKNVLTKYLQLNEMDKNNVSP